MPYSHEEHLQAAEQALAEGDYKTVETLVETGAIELEELPLEDGSPEKDLLEQATEVEEEDDEAQKKLLEARELARDRRLNTDELRIVLNAALDFDDALCARVALHHLDELGLNTLQEHTLKSVLAPIIGKK